MRPLFLSEEGAMKFIKSLIEAEVITLEELFRNYPDHRARVRAHGILLSYRGFSISEIVKFYQVDRDTVSGWMNNWESVMTSASIRDLINFIAPSSDRNKGLIISRIDTL